MSEPTIDALLADLAALEAVATARPWRATSTRVYAGIDDFVAAAGRGVDCRLAVAAVNALPALRGEIERLALENQQMRVREGVLEKRIENQRASLANLNRAKASLRGMLGKPQQELADQLLTCQERVRLDAEHAKEDRAEVERLRAELARAREAAPSRWALMRPCVRVRTEPDEFGSPPQWIEVRAHTWSKCGNLVVSDSLAGDGWVAVTHAPTGLRLATVFTVAEGECVLAAVEALGLDWSFEQPDAVPEEQRAAVKAAINKAAGREVRR